MVALADLECVWSLVKSCPDASACACRAYEHEHGCNSHIFFHTTTTEKGEKSVSSTEVLLKLDDNCDKVSHIVKNAAAEPMRVTLDEVTTSNFRSTFRCYMWGDVSAWAFMACLDHDLHD